MTPTALTTPSPVTAMPPPTTTPTTTTTTTPTTTTIYVTTRTSPMGDLVLLSDGERLTGLHTNAAKAPVPAGVVEDAGPFAEVLEQLDAYLAGERREFDVALSMAGTPFQRLVWEALLTIPYGETTSYGAIAARIGRRRAARAVGAANGRNPVSIIVPCHRVIGADGSPVGYGGGLDRKAWLLEHEATVARRG